MSASTEARDGLRKPNDLIEYPLAASTKVYKDTLVFNLGGNGLVGPARTGGTGDLFLGVARDTVDNSNGAAAAKYVRVEKTHTFAFAFADGTPTYAVNGKPAYASDDQTVTATATGAIQVGTFVFDRDLAAAGLVRVNIAKAVQ